MTSVVYLVLVFKLNMIDAMSSTALPQANLQQCQANAKRYENDRLVRKAYCITGVK